VAGSAAEGDSREPLHENKFGKAYEVIISAEKPPLKRNFGELFCGLGYVMLTSLLFIYSFQLSIG